MQPKRPRFNPLILALALAAVLMIWSVLGTGGSSTSGSTMSYSTVVHYFEHNQVTDFTLDRNTSIITLTLKEGDLALPDTSSAAGTTQATGGLPGGMLSTSRLRILRGEEQRRHWYSAISRPMPPCSSRMGQIYRFLRCGEPGRTDDLRLYLSRRNIP